MLYALLYYVNDSYKDGVATPLSNAGEYTQCHLMLKAIHLIREIGRQVEYVSCALVCLLEWNCFEKWQWRGLVWDSNEIWEWFTSTGQVCMVGVLRAFINRLFVSLSSFYVFKRLQSVSCSILMLLFFIVFSNMNQIKIDSLRFCGANVFVVFCIQKSCTLLEVLVVFF